MEQFTFYEWYADILQSMDDISAGKLAICICAYEFEDREPMEQLSDKEDFYWSNIAGILKEVKETESIGKIPKKYNLQQAFYVLRNVLQGNETDEYKEARDICQGNLCVYVRKRRTEV